MMMMMTLSSLSLSPSKALSLIDAAGTVKIDSADQERGGSYEGAGTKLAKVRPPEEEEGKKSSSDLPTRIVLITTNEDRE